MLNTVIFIGRSGCGKGTQAHLLMDWITARDREKRKILYIETGKGFREFIRGESYSSRISRQVLEKDIRQPDFLACWMWGNVLIEELEENMHLVFDGVARAIDEAQVMTTAMKFYQREKPVVIFLNVSRKWSEERLLGRGRSDDRTISKITKRLNWFDEDTTEALEYFRKNPLYNFFEINGEQTVEQVHQEILEKYDQIKN